MNGSRRSIDSGANSFVRRIAHVLFIEEQGREWFLYFCGILMVLVTKSGIQGRYKEM